MTLREVVEWGVDGVHGGQDGALTAQPGIMRCPSREVAEQVAAQATLGVHRVACRTTTRWEYADEATPTGEYGMGGRASECVCGAVDAELQRVSDVAGEAIGCDPSLRSTACVDALASHKDQLKRYYAELKAYVAVLRAEVERLAGGRAEAGGCGRVEAPDAVASSESGAVGDGGGGTPRSLAAAAAGPRACVPGRLNLGGER